MPRRKKEKEQVFHVEVITKARVNEDGEWEYFVKWAGYGSDSDSWEPAENMQQCDRLLTSFWKHIGMDNQDYPLGYEVAAENGWIEKEKQYFADAFYKSSKKDGRSSKSKSTMSESSAGDSQNSDQERAPPPSRAPAKKKPAKPIRVVESDSESDGNSRKQVKAIPKAPIPPPRGPKVSAQAKRPEMPSASGSSSIAPPKVPIVRTHQEQRTNPLVKTMNLPSQSVEAGSALSTKQRIAAGIPLPSTGPKPLPPAPKKAALASLSFKRTKPSVPPVIQTKETTTSSAAVATPASPVIQPTNITNDADIVASPQPMDVDPPDNDLFDYVADMDDPAPPVKEPEISVAPIPPKSHEELNAEQFLRTVDIPELSAPLEAPVPAEQPQPELSLPKSLPIPPKIPKKWKWSGDLFISTSESKAELLCAVTITDQSGITNSAHINLLLSPLDSLRIPKLYSAMDLRPLLRACGKAQYFGRLESKDSSDGVAIEGLGHHLSNEGLAAVIPLLLEGTEAAVLVVFSRAQQGLTKALQVPEHLLTGTPVLVVLLPLLVSFKASSEAVGWRSVETVQQSLPAPQDVDDEQHHEPAFPKDAMVHQAMSLLCFPMALLDFFNTSSSRSYCIWPRSDKQPPGLDTPMLESILKSTKAPSAKVEEDVRVIFIPNSHLEIIHTMPSLVSRRVNSPEVQFWTYGYSANMTSDRWRLQEIYPIGGIVTFTASALAEDLVGCHRLISQIIEHPLWQCHLIPEVLAVSHLFHSNGEQAPPSESFLGPILDFVDLGSISAIRMPDRDQQAAWLAQLFDPSLSTGHDLLEVYLGALKSRNITSCMTTEQLCTYTNDELAKDLVIAQTQPVLMENYRRFVVIRATSEIDVSFEKDGLESVPLSQFSFKDNYFHNDDVVPD